MEGRLFFFELDGDTRKVNVISQMSTMSDVMDILIKKYNDREMDMSNGAEFWTKDDRFGVKHQVTNPSDIKNGAVLEVIFNSPSTYDRSSGARRWEPYPSSGYAAPSGYGGFPGGPDMSMSRGPKPGVQVCSIHKKQRTLQNLTKNEEDQWECTPDSQCKTQATLGGSMHVCSLHGKNRTLSNLEENADGNWVCIEGNRCIVTGRGEPKGRFRGDYGNFSAGLGYGGGFGRSAGHRAGLGSLGDDFGRWGGRRIQPRSKGIVCSIHGKRRSGPNLRSNGSGGWVCLPNSKCRVN